MLLLLSFFSLIICLLYISIIFTILTNSLHKFLFFSFRIVGEFLWEKMKSNYEKKNNEATSTSTTTSTSTSTLTSPSPFEDFIESDEKLKLRLKVKDELEKRIEKIKIEEEIKLIENQSYQDSIDPLGKR